MTDLALTTLAECEAVIERNARSMRRALDAIRVGHLYRETHKTFDSYCRERWGFSGSRAYQHIEAGEISTIVETLGLPVPTNEAQARALSPLRGDPTRLAEAWSEAVAETDGKPTAKAVEAAVERAILYHPTKTWTCSDHDTTQPVGASCPTCEADRVSTISTATLLNTIELAARAIGNGGADDFLRRARRWPGELLIPDPVVLERCSVALNALATAVRKESAA